MRGRRRGRILRAVRAILRTRRIMPIVRALRAVLSVLRRSLSGGRATKATGGVNETKRESSGACAPCRVVGHSFVDGTEDE